MSIRVFLLIIISFSLCLLNCGGPAPYPNDTKFQKIIFKDSTFQSVTQVNPKFINIYVDVSLSNKGFVSESKSDFLNSIRELCSIVNPDTKINFFSFGTQLELIGKNTKEALDYFQEEKNYNNSETRFDLLLKNFKKNSQEEINLIFTDGIHSENKQTQNSYVELASEIRKYVKEGNLFGLIGNKGYFSGMYYPEVKAKIFQYNGARPYYCFIFGSRRHIDFIKTHIIEYWNSFFLLYPAAVTTVKADLNNTNMGIDESMAKDNTFVLQNVQSADTFKIPISIESDDFRFWDLSNIESTMEMKRVDIYYESDKDSMKVLEENDISKKTKINVLKFENNQLSLGVNYSPDKNKGMTIYRLKITPKMPRWISNWSTDYDGDEAHVGKTFALESFTHNLLKITNDNQFTLFSLYFIL